MNEIKTVEEEVQYALTIASKLVVTNTEEEKFAVEFCKILKAGQDRVGQEFDQGVDDAYALYKSLYAQRGKYLEPLKQAEKDVKNRIKDYRLEIERVRAEEERRARLAAEASLKKEQEKLLDEAAKALETGDLNKATILSNQSTSMEVGGVFVQSKAVKQEGMSVRKSWKARVVDVNAIPRQFLIVDEKALNAYAKEHGANAKVAGVEFYEDSIISVRA